MIDERWNALAHILVNHSTGVQEEDRVLIIMRETDAAPLTEAVYRRAVEAGAYPQVLFHGAGLERALLTAGSRKQVDWKPELFATAMEWANVCIDLRGTPNLYAFSGIDSGVVGAHRKAEGKISEMRTRQTRWTICRIPNALFAQQARMSEEEIMNIWFASCLVDWSQESVRLKKLKDRFDGTREIVVKSEDTDLRLSVEGRTFVIDDGHINMPGGEVFSAPVEDSVEGHITFTNPGVFAGVLMEDIRLSFSAGVVTDASARSNEAFLHQILDMDDGARRVGEVAVGTNEMLTSFTNDILLDEKIAGTAHIALGRSYAECGGRNESALHWDIVKDLRSDGSLYMDGKAVIENGALLEQ